MSESNNPLDLYLAAADEVHAAFSGMSQEQLVAQPVAGKWSAMQVLCHIVDTDLLTATRIRAALTSQPARLLALTTEQLTAMLAVDGRNAEEGVNLFRLVRNQTARIVRASAPGSLSRELILIKSGGEEVTKTVGTLLSGIAGHVARHLEFVREKRRLLGISV